MMTSLGLQGQPGINLYARQLHLLFIGGTVFVALELFNPDITMKKILLLLITILMLGSCEENYLVPADEVPSWLKDRIAEAEKEIKSDPKSGMDICAWIRYSYKGDYYYEWINLLSSYWPHLYNKKGELMTFGKMDIEKYWGEKCCKKFIWKGSKYIDVNEDGR